MHKQPFYNDFKLKSFWLLKHTVCSILYANKYLKLGLYKRPMDCRTKHVTCFKGDLGIKIDFEMKRY